MLRLRVVSIAFGIAVLKAGKEAEPCLAFDLSGLAIVRKILWWVIRLPPIGTIGLLSRTVGQYGWMTLWKFGR